MKQSPERKEKEEAVGDALPTDDLSSRRFSLLAKRLLQVTRREVIEVENRLSENKDANTRD